jgi:hypothetical protein
MISTGFMLISNTISYLFYYRFLTGDDATRNLMLKLIPHIADGSWVVRQSVGTTPVITGKVNVTTS